MATAVVDSPRNGQAPAWWFLDTFVVGHRCAPDMDTVVLEVTLPVGSALAVDPGHWVSMPRNPHTVRVAPKTAKPSWPAWSPR